MKRCDWAKGLDIEIEYHDTEWGVYKGDDAHFFEFIVLESFQAGLSWKTILVKREAMRQAYFNFDVNKLAQAKQDDLDRWMLNPDLIRSKLKGKSLISNAQAFIQLVNEFGSFENYLKTFIPNLPIVHNIETIQDVPAEDEASTAIAKDLKKRGFKFVGPLIMYAFLQATGVYDDHINDCFRKQSKD